MTRHPRHWQAGVAVCAVAALAAVLYHSPAQDRPPAQEKGAPGDKEAPKDEPAEVAAVRKTAAEFAAAFNKGDAKAVAAFWTKDGEYVGPDGDAVRGRDALEKTYADFFKANPKATVEVRVASVRLLGRHTALEEGALTVRHDGARDAAESRYSVLHVRDEDGWRMATVREWVPSAAELASLKDVEWLVGEWESKSDEAEMRVTYAWDEDKAYLRGRYTVKKGGKVVASGTQTIAKDPAGELRSWVFDASGSFGEASWTRDGGRWVIESAGLLPDGSEVTAVNLLVPLGKDAFTWQATERTAAGSALPGLPPVKVTRVKGGK